MAGGISGKISLEYLIEQALKIPKVKVDRAEFLSSAFAKEGILVRQIVEEGPVACDYSDIELDDMAEKLILRRTSESSAMSFAAGIPGGLAIAATIPADTLQFFAMSLRMAQELAYLYGAKDFWACEGEDGTLVRYQLICSHCRYCSFSAEISYGTGRRFLRINRRGAVRTALRGDGRTA